MDPPTYPYTHFHRDLVISQTQSQVIFGSPYQNTSPHVNVMFRTLETPRTGSDIMFITLQRSRFTLSHNGWHLRTRIKNMQSARKKLLRVILISNDQHVVLKRTLISNKHHCSITGAIMGPFIIDFFSYPVYRLTYPQKKKWRTCWLVSHVTHEVRQTSRIGRTSGLPGAVYDARLNLNVLLVK